MFVWGGVEKGGMEKGLGEDCLERYNKTLTNILSGSAPVQCLHDD